MSKSKQSEESQLSIINEGAGVSTGPGTAIDPNAMRFPNQDMLANRLALLG